MLYVIRYIAFGVIEGDWINDWLTQCPEWFVDAAAFVLQVVG